MHGDWGGVLDLGSWILDPTTEARHETSRHCHAITRDSGMVHGCKCCRRHRHCESLNSQGANANLAEDAFVEVGEFCVLRFA
jgi:hypothetical protein